MPNSDRTGPSYAAVALATSIDEATYSDVYAHAAKIDQAWENAREAVRQEERDRIFAMSPFQLFAEFWSGRKLRKILPKS